MPLYGALLAVLAGMRAPPLARAPPAVLAALLRGAGAAAGEGAAALEARQAEVDAGAAALLRSAGWLVGTAAADALRPGARPATRAQVRHRSRQLHMLVSMNIRSAAASAPLWQQAWPRPGS